MSTASQLDSEDRQLARSLWQLLEPFHMLTYFAAESREVTDKMGCTGGWMSYFGLRAAPLGAVAPEIVVATFYNFHPDRVRRAIPEVWRIASPEEFVSARLSSVDAAMRRLLGEAVESPELAEAAELAREAALLAPIAGRPLAAANRALEWPTQPHLKLWHAQTILRESRGDAHVAALVSAGLDPCETLIAFAAAGRVDANYLRGARGWSQQEWADAGARLEARGLLMADGMLTKKGAAVRTWVEERTDLGAVSPWLELGRERRDRLVELARPLLGRIVDAGEIPATNPMGLVPSV